MIWVGLGRLGLGGCGRGRDVAGRGLTRPSASAGSVVGPSAPVWMGSGKGVGLFAIWDESQRDSLGIRLRGLLGALVGGVRR